MVAGVQERALACMDAVPPQAVANTMWALAHLCRGQAPRADVLAARGYRTDVIEFVAGEHTAKNLMIRAVATGRSDTDAAARVDDLMTRWGVRPAIVDRLGGVEA